MVETATGIETEAEAIAVGVDNTVVDTAEMGEHMGVKGYYMNPLQPPKYVQRHQCIHQSHINVLSQDDQWKGGKRQGGS